MKTSTKIAVIRSFGYWVRECTEGSPVKYIVVDPDGDEEGWMAAGGEEVLDDTIDELEAGAPETVAKEVARYESELTEAES